MYTKYGGFNELNAYPPSSRRVSHFIILIVFSLYRFVFNKCYVSAGPVRTVKPKTKKDDEMLHCA